VFMIGLLGSVHCVGMCGGIVGALSVVSAPRFPVAVVVSSGKRSAAGWRVVAYNLGRIASYVMAGAIAGGVTGGVRTLAGLSFLQKGGYGLANLMLVVLGLYLMDAWRALVRLEAMGQIVWQRVQPWTKYLLPLDSPLKMLAAGALWGWLPCGMVYSVLLMALLTGSAFSGAMVMLAFGLGTLPALFTMGLCGASLRSALQHRLVRIVSGLIVLGFGLLGLMRAAYGLPLGWFDAICITPAVSGLAW